ncbi:MAG: acetate kinase [Gemmataceae bacterium]|nr:acetate kinase [Gemmataceae bacterium]
MVEFPRPARYNARMRVLVVNAGSTNVKLSVLDGEAESFAITVEHESPAAAVADGLDQVRAKGLLPVDGVGHRVVHGGAVFTEGVRVTDEVLAKLTELNDLAPLHNPPALQALAEARRQLPDVPHVAAFDTAFHSSMTELADTYAVPWKWTKEWGIRKFGFHGLSHEYCSRRAAEMLGRAGDKGLRVVVAHLGGGCSLGAVKGGLSVDTTMGFTPMDGLMMATRCGAVDPGIMLYVMRHRGLTVDDVERVLDKESGLLGVSGVSADIREVRKAATGGNARAATALKLFSYRIQLGIGAMTAALGGIDALVFAAGIGEHDAAERGEVCAGLGFLGMVIDPKLNNACRPDADISAPGALCRVLVIHTREDVTIAREVERVLFGERGA